jgi:hypothetical protein
MSVLSAQQGIYSLDTSYNQRAFQDNKDVLAKYNATIATSRGKEKINQYMGDASAGAGGFTALTKGAGEVSNARNFDSELAGFGAGKGVSGYFNPRTQAQLLKARVGQTKSTIQTAMGKTDAIDKNNPEALGLKRYTNLQTSTGNTIPAKPLSADPETAASQARASGGIISEDVAKATAEGGAEAGEKAVSHGIVGNIVKKVGGMTTNLPVKQLGAVADVAGKGLGVLNAGEGIADLVKGHTSGEEKVKDIGDIVSGGLDVASMAMPILAPVAGVASLISGIGDIFAGKDKAKEEQQTAATEQKKQTQVGVQGVSLTSMGQMASGQVSKS